MGTDPLHQVRAQQPAAQPDLREGLAALKEKRPPRFSR